MKSSSPEVRITVPPTQNAIHLLRTAQQHHVSLSAMADQKANIMIGVSALIFSMLLGYTQKEGLTLPVLILFVSTFAAAITSIMAVMPAVKTTDRVQSGVNPLFFGSFSEKSPEEYCAEMEKILKSDDSIYTAMAMDMYYLGGVLYRKKYKYLAYSYRIFLVGLVLAFVTGLFTHWE
ncbi:MAG TPA: Pycsar system effector family protein [Verrucomicrobiae bacterium]